MSARPSLLKLLHPKWLMLHAVTIAACYVMVLLGRWQWHVAHQHHGDIRYYAYAFQWWAFVGFTILMWYRVILDYLRKHRVDQVVVAAPATVNRYLSYTPPQSLPVETDPERIRFNTYLAGLYTADFDTAEPDSSQANTAQANTVTRHQSADRKSEE